jgi:Protein of unknown function (DUF2934)
MPAPEPDTIAAAPGVEGTENNSAGVPSEAGDDAPMEAMATESGRTERGRGESGRTGRGRSANDRSASDRTASGQTANDRTAAGGDEQRNGQPSEEEIRTRAYHRYLERGGSHGMDFEDWLEAERELKSGR